MSFRLMVVVTVTATDLDLAGTADSVGPDGFKGYSLRRRFVTLKLLEKVV